MARRLELARVNGRAVLLWQRRRGWSYDPAAGRWEALPSLPAGARSSEGSRIVPLDDRRVVAGVLPAARQAGLGTVLDLEDGWIGTAAAGVRAGRTCCASRRGRARSSPSPTGWGPPGRAPPVAVFWDPVLDGLLRMPPEVVGERAGYAAAWTGDELLDWGGYDGDGTLADGTRWRLGER